MQEDKKVDVRYTCPHCHASFPKPSPVEPLYTLEEAAALVPMRHSTLKTYLSKRKEYFGEPIYMRLSRGVVQSRLLSASDVVKLRAMRTYVQQPGSRKRIPLIKRILPSKYEPFGD